MLRLRGLVRLRDELHNQVVRDLDVGELAHDGLARLTGGRHDVEVGGNCLAQDLDVEDAFAGLDALRVRESQPHRVDRRAVTLVDQR